MTENEGCAATFDKDNKLQTQLTMNVIRLQTVHRQYRRPAKGLYSLHGTLPRIVPPDIQFSEGYNSI